MAVTQNTYTGNGSTQNFVFAFNYLDPSHVKAKINGTLTTAFTFFNASTLRFNTAPANGAAVLIYRETPSDNLLADYTAGGALRDGDLELTLQQVLNVSQETQTFAENQSTAGLQDQIATANNNASSALTTANSAAATATGIAGTANTALSNSNTAVSTANAASSAATTAASTANAALPKSGGTMTGDVVMGSQTDLRFGDADNSHYVGFQAPATVTTNRVWTLPATDGTAGQGLTTNGSNVLGWATLLAQGAAITAGTSVATTSGTAVDFTSIPSWVKQITLMLNNVSTNGASEVLIRLGTSSGIETTGYLSWVGGISPPSSISFASYNNGIAAGFIGAAAARFGTITLSLIVGNTWAISGITTDAATGAFAQLTGSKTLAGTLDRLRLTTASGTDVFDLGSLNIHYEG